MKSVGAGRGGGGGLGTPWGQRCCNREWWDRLSPQPTLPPEPTSPHSPTQHLQFERAVPHDLNVLLHSSMSLFFWRGGGGRKGVENSVCLIFVGQKKSYLFLKGQP